MDRVAATYFHVRRLEERIGLLARVGERLVYRAQSRLPWIEPPFEEPPGLVEDVLRIEYCEARGPDNDPWDNHYHFHIAGFEAHGGICSAEVLAFFSPWGDEAGFALLAARVRRDVIRTLRMQGLIAPCAPCLTPARDSRVVRFPRT